MNIFYTHTLLHYYIKIYFFFSFEPGTFQSVGKGHTVCIIKQVKAFKLDKTYKAMKPMDPKRNKGLADFLRACASYAWVEFGPKGMCYQKIEK